MESLRRHRNTLVCCALVFASAVPGMVQGGSDGLSLLADPGEVWDSAASAVPRIVQGGNDGVSLLADPNDKVWLYATKCYERLKIDAADLLGPFKCKDGELLYTSENNVVKDLEFPKDMVNPDKAGDFPNTCDRPAWLDASRPPPPPPPPPGDYVRQHCYGQTYVQKLMFPNKKVTGALLCRHKTRWILDEDKFDDVAMILHNEGNGETCFFQTLNGKLANGTSVERDGEKVPAPHRVRNHDYWLPPSEAAAEGCNGCHDSGPWMNSRWMEKSGITLEDQRTTPYVINKGVGFDKWKEPVFVTVASEGLADGNVKPYTCGNPNPKPPDSCTSCHKISTQETHDRWIPYATGRKFPPRSNVNIGQTFDIAYWMPVGHQCANQADWKKEFDAHVNKLVACAKAEGDPKVDACKVQKTKARADTARAGVLPIRLPLVEQCLGTGVQICGNYGGQDFVANASDPEETVVSIVPGSTLTMAWDGDADHDSCGVQATFPPAIKVNNGIEDIGTGSNWVLSESPQTIGSLLQPGRYRFELSCDDESEDAFGPTLIFEVPGETLTVVEVQAIVGSTPGDRASNIPPDLTHTTVDARPADEVAIAWSTANAIEGSCRLTESHTGDFWDADSGFMDIVLVPDAAQTYTLSCDGADGFSYTVSTTVQVGPSLSLGITGTCPGQVTMSVSGGTPGGRGGIIYSPNLGTDPILGGPCAGTATQLMSPRLLSPVTFDANGELVMVRSAPPAACGAHVQVVDGTNCGVSNVASPGSIQPPLEGAPLCFKWASFCDGVQVNAISPNGDITAEWYHYDCANNSPMNGVTGGDFVDPCPGGNTGTLLRSFAPNGPGDWYFNVDTPTDGTLDMAQGLHPGGSCWIDELAYNLLMGPCVGVKGQNRSSIQ